MRTFAVISKKRKKKSKISPHSEAKWAIYNYMWLKVQHTRLYLALFMDSSSGSCTEKPRTNTSAHLTGKSC